MPTTFRPIDASPALPAGWLSVDLGPDLARSVRAIMSTRAGGVSQGPYAQCNLGDHVGDEPMAVAQNRQVFESAMAARPVWMQQVHGHRLVRLSHEVSSDAPDAHGLWVINPSDGLASPQADGAVTTEPRLACTVMVADCLPVLLAAPEGRGVAALHAGWRGLAGVGNGNAPGHGIVHAGVRALCDITGADPHDVRAWLGPCIGPARFEVGSEVLRAFGVDPDASAGHTRFRACGVPYPEKWLADLPGLASDVLLQLGVRDIRGGQWCTVTDASRFFSFRRDGVTGRQAASICIC